MTDVEQYLLELDAPQQAIMQYLHDTLMAQPQVTAKIRYKVPFYYRKSWICYLNPKKNDAVELAFIRGNELSNEQGLLAFNGRKQVAGYTISSLEDIPEETLWEVIQEALLLDDSTPYASKRSPKKRK